jgi:hypothetical protein
MNHSSMNRRLASMILGEIHKEFQFRYYGVLLVIP